MLTLGAQNPSPRALIALHMSPEFLLSSAMCHGCRTAIKPPPVPSALPTPTLPLVASRTMHIETEREGK